jgi:adenylate kinase
MTGLRLLLLASPGAGKGTQAARLTRYYGVEHIATGEMLRRAVEAGTPLGLLARNDIERGDLVPDDLVMELVLEGLKALAETGYILDGFPRNLRQALLAEEAGIVVDVAVYLEISRAEAIRRMLGRSGEHRRADDVEAVIRHRIHVFARETYPLCQFYDERGVLVPVDAEQPADRVTSLILERLAELGFRPAADGGAARPG